MNEDIRDIRAPLAIPAWWHWPLAIALAAVAALAVILLVRWWQKRRAAKLTPLQRTLQALLAAETHARAGRAHDWADIVAETMRGALAARLGADVLPKTTSELAACAWAQPSPAESEPAGKAQLAEAPALLDLLETCDLARFALASLDADALLAKTAVARELAETLFGPRQQRPTPPLHPVPVTS